LFFIFYFVKSKLSPPPPPLHSSIERSAATFFLITLGENLADQLDSCKIVRDNLQRTREMDLCCMGVACLSCHSEHIFFE
jgi:hypothetical protein